MLSALWKNGKYFVADQPMTVEVSWRIKLEFNGTSNTDSVKGKTQLVKEALINTFDMADQERELNK